MFNFSSDLISVCGLCAHLILSLSVSLSFAERTHTHTHKCKPHSDILFVMMIETNFKSISHPLILNSQPAKMFSCEINCPQMQSIHSSHGCKSVVHFVFLYFFSFFFRLFVSVRVFYLDIHRIRFSHFVVINELTRFLLITCAYFSHKKSTVRSQNKLKINL